MTGMILVFGSYALLLLFLITFFLKARKIAGLPNHLRWELSPIPGEKGKGHYGGSYLEEFEWWTKPREKSLITEVVYMFKEIVFLKGVYENNKRLWYLSFPFHIGLYLVTIMTALMFLNAILISTGVDSSGGIVAIAITYFAAAAYIIGGIGTFGLVIKRIFNPDLKKFTTGGTIFNLVFILAIFISGAVALLTVPDFAGAMTRFADSLIKADTGVVLPGAVTLHWTINLLFLAYLPFTKMLHFLAKYFTYHEVRWNDAPMHGNAKLEEDVNKMLEQPVSWAAPHLKADGKKNWVDIVSEEKKS